MKTTKFFASIRSPRRLTYFILVGLLVAWLTKDLITPLLIQGKTFSGRSLIIQVTLLTAFSGFFAIVTHAISRFISSLLPERIRPFTEVGNRLGGVLKSIETFLKSHVIFSSIVVLLLFFLITLAWFDRTSYTVLAGDDLDLYLRSVMEGDFFEVVFAPNRGIKLRTLSLILLFAMKGLGGDYQSYVLFNLTLLAGLSLTLYLLVRAITKNHLFSILAGILFITSRFSLYLVYQVYGAMEVLALFFCLLLYYWLYQYLKESDPARAKKAILLSIVFYLCLLQSHERYMVNLAVIGLVVLIKHNEYFKQKLLYGALAGLPLLAHFVIATFIVGGDSLNIGQQRATDTLDVIPQYIMVGLVNVLGLNYAPRWMGGLDFWNYEPSYLLAALVSILPLGYFTGQFILRALDRSLLLLSDSKSGLLILAGMLVNLAPFAITSREEQRFLAASYILLLVLFFFCASRVMDTGLDTIAKSQLKPHKFRPRNTFGWGAVMLFSVLIFVGNNFHYSHRSSIYYFTAQSVAQQTHDIVQANQGLGAAEKIYLVGIRDANWALAHGYLFEYYFNANELETVFVDSLEQIPIEEQNASDVMLLGYNEHYAIVRIDKE